MHVLQFGQPMYFNGLQKLTGKNKAVMQALLFQNMPHQTPRYCGTMQFGWHKCTVFARCLWGDINSLARACSHKGSKFTFGDETRMEQVFSAPWFEVSRPQMLMQKQQAFTREWLTCGCAVIHSYWQLYAALKEWKVTVDFTAYKCAWNLKQTYYINQTQDQKCHIAAHPSFMWWLH